MPIRGLFRRDEHVNDPYMYQNIKKEPPQCALNQSTYHLYPLAELTLSKGSGSSMELWGARLFDRHSAARKAAIDLAESEVCLNGKAV